MTEASLDADARRLAEHLRLIGLILLGEELETGNGNDRSLDALATNLRNYL